MARLFICFLLFCTVTVLAGPIEFTDLTAYNAAVGTHTIITFEGLTPGTILSTQYSGLGVTHSDGSDLSVADGNFMDGYGARGGSPNWTIALSFSGTMDHIGVEYPGAVQLMLYQGPTLVYTSSQFGGSGSGFFAGITGVAFDNAELFDWSAPDVYIDSLHFGTSASIPEPSTCFLLFVGLAGLAAAKRVFP